MAKKTPEQIAEKFQRGVAGAGSDYLSGVQNPSRPWASATVAGGKRWTAAIQEAIQKNSFARGVQRAGDAKWAERAATIGAQRYTTAAPQAAAGYSQVAGRIMAAASAAQAAVQSMPNESIEQRIARSAAAQRAISKYWEGGG